MKYTSVTDLKYANAEGTLIECKVNFAGLGVIPFTASPNDIRHSTEIFNAAKEGLYGPIAEYVETENLAIPVNSTDIARNRRNYLLQCLDNFLSNPLRWASFSDDIKASYALYRQQLLDVPQQQDFPQTINWPSPPNGYNFDKFVI